MKRTARKLTLSLETLRDLSSPDLTNAAGGAIVFTARSCPCIQSDTCNTWCRTCGGDCG